MAVAAGARLYLLLLKTQMLPIEIDGLTAKQDLK